MCVRGGMEKGPRTWWCAVSPSQPAPGTAALRRNVAQIGARRSEAGASTETGRSHPQVAGSPRAPDQGPTCPSRWSRPSYPALGCRQRGPGFCPPQHCWFWMEHGGIAAERLAVSGAAPGRGSGRRVGLSWAAHLHPHWVPACLHCTVLRFCANVGPPCC